ncbi:ribonuclease HII [Fluviispira multicolorata]|uniref:ribonuclease HII n=1 Tax=Fluviispira multicolorata TaxID=2654512 RepID=UPI00137572E8|nr:ribonuclease HII [Fluviispira multicolorata]
MLKILSTEFSSKDEFSAFIAIDEVGRGCVAGSVVSCASLWILKDRLKQYSFKKQEWLSEIKDSKKISEKKRKACFQKIIYEYNYSFESIPVECNFPNNPEEIFISKNKKHIYLDQYENIGKDFERKSSAAFECISFALGEVTANEIDNYNIWNSVQLAAARALILLNERTHLNETVKNSILSSAVILMDGNHSIKLPLKFINNLQITVIKADDLFVSVGFSSIIAKVYRDTCMEKQDFQYPTYGFSNHKGYGTPKHLSLIQQIGISPIHRTSFLKNYLSSTLF